MSGRGAFFFVACLTACRGGASAGAVAGVAAVPVEKLTQYEARIKKLEEQLAMEKLQKDEAVAAAAKTADGPRPDLNPRPSTLARLT